MFELPLMAFTLSNLLSLSVFALQFRVLDDSIVWELNFLSVCWPFTLQIFFSMPSNSKWGIPNNAGLCPGTTKNIHLAILSLWYKFTVCTTNCSILKLLNVLILLSCPLSLLLTLETEFWIMWMVLNYHQFLASIFYVMHALLWLVLDS